MESPNPSGPLLSLSTFIHHHCLRGSASPPISPAASKTPKAWLETSCSRRPGACFPPRANHALAATTATLSSDYVAKSLVGTAVYTVSNGNNEFVLLSDPREAKSKIMPQMIRAVDDPTGTSLFGNEMAAHRSHSIPHLASVVPVALVFHLVEQGKRIDGQKFRWIFDVFQVLRLPLTMHEA